MTSPESSIPDKCLTCPSITTRKQHIDERKEWVAHIADLSMSNEVERAAALTLRYLEENEPELIVEEGITTEAVARHLRMTKSHEIELADELTEEHEAEMVDFAKGCLGSLKLRGSRDGGRVITAEVCMSPRLNDGDSTEPVNVNRKII